MTRLWWQFVVLPAMESIWNGINDIFTVTAVHRCPCLRWWSCMHVSVNWLWIAVLHMVLCLFRNWIQNHSLIKLTTARTARVLYWTLQAVRLVQHVLLIFIKIQLLATAENIQWNDALFRLLTFCLCSHLRFLFDPVFTSVDWWQKAKDHAMCLFVVASYTWGEEAVRQWRCSSTYHCYFLLV